MSKLQQIKERAAEIAAGRQRDGRIDQEQARIERAKEEARRDAKRDQVQERVEEAREAERERVMNDRGGGLFSSIASAVDNAADAVDDGDGERLDDIAQAMGTDFDGDGDPLAAEFGLQSSGRADREDNAIQGLTQQVDNNTSRLQSVEAEVGRRAGTRRRSGGGGGGVGTGPIDPAEFGFDFGDGDGSGAAPGVEPIDPADFGFGGDDGGLFGSDR